MNRISQLARSVSDAYAENTILLNAPTAHTMAARSANTGGSLPVLENVLSAVAPCFLLIASVEYARRAYKGGQNLAERVRLIGASSCALIGSITSFALLSKVTAVGMKILGASAAGLMILNLIPRFKKAWDLKTKKKTLQDTNDIGEIRRIATSLGILSKGNNLSDSTPVEDTKDINKIEDIAKNLGINPSDSFAEEEKIIQKIKETITEKIKEKERFNYVMIGATLIAATTTILATIPTLGISEGVITGVMLLSFAPIIIGDAVSAWKSYKNSEAMKKIGNSDYLANSLLLLSGVLTIGLSLGVGQDTATKITGGIVGSLIGIFSGTLLTKQLQIERQTKEKSIGVGDYIDKLKEIFRDCWRDLNLLRKPNPL